MCNAGGHAHHPNCSNHPDHPDRSNHLNHSILHTQELLVAAIELGTHKVLYNAGVLAVASPRVLWRQLR